MEEADVEALIDRSQYPTLQDAAYLNQASLGLIGSPAVDAMHRLLDRVARHGNLHMSDEEEVAFLDDLRARAASLFETGSSSVAIVAGASELLGQAPFLLRPPSGSKVLLVASDFPAITRTWLSLAGQGGCQVELVDDRPESDLTDDLIAAIDDRTSVLAVGWVQYATGTRVDVARLREATQQAGVALVVDATQGAGALRSDPGAWGADLVVSSGYKWLGGHGGAAIGVIGSRLADRVPALPGWMGAPAPFEFDATQVRFADDARRFTQSTMSYVSVIGLTTSVGQLLAVGLDRIEAHAVALGRELLDLVGASGWRPFRDPNTPGASPHIVSLAHPDRLAGEAIRHLVDQRIVCSGRGGRVRVSLAPYNDTGDLEALAAALE